LIFVGRNANENINKSLTATGRNAIGGIHTCNDQ